MYIYLQSFHLKNIIKSFFSFLWSEVFSPEGQRRRTFLLLRAPPSTVGVVVGERAGRQGVEPCSAPPQQLQKS